MAADTVAFIEREISAPVRLLGCSDGATVALHVALSRPDLVVSLVLAALHAAGPTLTTDDLAALPMETLVIVGDDDEVRIEHAVEMYRALPDGELAVIPRSTHGFAVEKPELAGRLIRDFLAADKGNGFAPIRRTETGDDKGPAT